jgi:hypothetical protein
MKFRSYNGQQFSRSPGILIVAEPASTAANAQATQSSTGTSNCRQPGKLIVAKHVLH